MRRKPLAEEEIYLMLGALNETCREWIEQEHPDADKLIKAIEKAEAIVKMFDFK